MAAFEIQKLNETLGYYLPSFFYMSIGDDNEEYNINKLNEHDLSVFFHEYIHFIQDISTFDGLNRAYGINELIRAINQMVYKDREHQCFPISLSKIDPKIILEQELICSQQGEVNNIHPFEIAFSINSKVAIGEEKLNIPVVKLKSGKGEIVDFGSAAIAESMAYILQMHCTNLDYVSPDSPYCLAQKLAQRIYPDMFSDDLYVLALCDSALMTSSPGTIFVYLAKYCKEHAEQFSTPESIIDFALKLEGRNFINGELINCIDFFKLLANYVKDALSTYVKIDAFPFTKEVEKLFAKSISNRIENPYFILNIYRGGYVKTNKAFVDFLNTFGTPLIGNNKGCYHQCPANTFDNFFMAYFNAIKEVLQLMLNGISKCGLKEWCKNSPDTKVNDYCDSSPWKHCTDERLCPYALIWRNWNLTDFKPFK